MRRVDRNACSLVVAISLAGCNSLGKDVLRPALLSEDSADAQSALVREMDRIAPRGRVDLTNHDPTKDPVLVVQPFRPTPNEGNSTAVPVYFDLMTDGKDCFARERRTGTLHPLPGVACRAR